MANRPKYHTYLKVYINFSRVMVREGQDTLLRLYYIARHLDRYRYITDKNGNQHGQAQGWIHHADLKRAMAFYGLTPAHERQARSQPLSESLLQFKDGKVHIASLEKACIALSQHVGELVKPGQPMEIPVSSISRLATFNAYNYAAWIGTKREISRENISEEWGITDQTQRNWERLAHVERTFNTVMIPEEEYIARKIATPIDKREGRDDRSYIWTQMVNGRKMVCYQTVNTYRACGIDKARWGQAKVVGRRVARLFERPNNDGTRKESCDFVRIFYNQQEVPANPVIDHSRTCVVKWAGITVNNAKGSAQAWLWLPYAPEGKKRKWLSKEEATDAGRRNFLRKAGMYYA